MNNLFDCFDAINVNQPVPYKLTLLPLNQTGANTKVGGRLRLFGSASNSRGIASKFARVQYTPLDVENPFDAANDTPVTVMIGGIEVAAEVLDGDERGRATDIINERVDPTVFKAVTAHIKRLEADQTVKLVKNANDRYDGIEVPIVVKGQYFTIPLPMGCSITDANNADREYNSIRFFLPKAELKAKGATGVKNKFVFDLVQAVNKGNCDYQFSTDELALIRSLGIRMDNAPAINELDGDVKDMDVMNESAELKI